MSISLPPSSPLITFLQHHLPNSLPPSQNEYTSSDLLKHVYPSQTYTDQEKTTITSYLTTSLHISSPTEDNAKTSERLSNLNTYLATRTTILGAKQSVADIAMYVSLAPMVRKWGREERTGERGLHHIVRFINFVQNSPIFGLQNLEEKEKVEIDEDDVMVRVKPLDPKAEKEKKKKEKEAAAAAGKEVNGEAQSGEAGKKSKKEAKAAQKQKSTGDTIASAVGSEVPVAQPSEGQTDTTKTSTRPTLTTAPPAEEGTQNQNEKKGKKKEKPKKAPPPSVEEKQLSPSLIDLRVGHILHCQRHPNADSLYVSQISVGDPEGTETTHTFSPPEGTESTLSQHTGTVVRTVCSGLNGLIPLEEMQSRKVIAVCNLKPVTMRGIKSCAMVLAASPRPKETDTESANHDGPVELVNPPPDSNPGEKVFFQGFQGDPEKQLNPKKKVWEMCQVGFTTDEDRRVIFDPEQVEQLKGKGLNVGTLKVGQGGEDCGVESLKGAVVR